MISRLTASAALFAILATATLAFASELQQGREKTLSTANGTMPHIVMPRVEITGQRPSSR